VGVLIIRVKSPSDKMGFLGVQAFKSKCVSISLRGAAGKLDAKVILGAEKLRGWA